MTTPRSFRPRRITGSGRHRRPRRRFHPAVWIYRMLLARSAATHPGPTRPQGPRRPLPARPRPSTAPAREITLMVRRRERGWRERGVASPGHLRAANAQRPDAVGEYR